MEEGTSKSPGYCGDTNDDYDALQWDTREDCEVRQILDRSPTSGHSWRSHCSTGRSMRFTELRRQIDGISQRMLARPCAI